MNRRLRFLILILVGLLWVSFRLGKDLGRPVSPVVPQEGGGDGVGEKRAIEAGRAEETKPAASGTISTIQILPSAPTLQSRLRVVSDSPFFNPSAHQYRWFANGREAGDEETLSLATFRQGDIISVEVTPKETRVSPATASVKIGNVPPAVKGIRLTPVPVYAGEAVRAEVTAEDADRDFIHLTYEWQVNGQPLQNDRDTLDGNAVHSADTLTVFVTPSDPFSKGERTSSAILKVGNRSPDILSTPPKLDHNGAYRYPVIARDPDGDALSYRLLEAPPGMSIDAAGVLSWTIPSSPMQPFTVRVEVSDGKGGQVIQPFTMRTELAPH